MSQGGAEGASSGGSPPGWHPDPWGAHTLRWWDGTAWTEHVHDGGVMAQGQAAASSAMASASAADERSSAQAAHLLTLLGFVVPFVHIIAPLVIWQTKGKESAFVAQHAKEALNFQISMTIYYLAAIVLVFVLVGLVLLPALFVLDIVFVVQQSIKAGNDLPSRYPMCIRFIS